MPLLLQLIAEEYAVNADLGVDTAMAILATIEIETDGVTVGIVVGVSIH